MKDRGLTCCRRIRRTCVAVERTDGIDGIVRYTSERARARSVEFHRSIQECFNYGEVPRS